jgi:quinol monooxygenase YgiN
MMETALSPLKQQPGCVDVLALNSENEPNEFVGINLWKSKEDADKYMSGSAQQILRAARPLR